MVIKPTHNLDIRLGVDLSELVKPQNIEGAKVALGASSDTDLAERFLNCVYQAVGSAISNFPNVIITSSQVTNELQNELENK